MPTVGIARSLHLNLRVILFSSDEGIIDTGKASVEMGSVWVYVR